MIRRNRASYYVPETAPGDGGIAPWPVERTYAQRQEPEKIDEMLLLNVRAQKQIIATLKQCKEQGMTNVRKGMYIFTIDNAIHMEETQLSFLEARMFA